MSRFVAPAAETGDAEARTPPNAVRLRRAAPSTSTSDARGRGGHTLPSDLLREASLRLGWAGLIYAAGYLLAYWAPFLINQAAVPDASQNLVQHLFAAASIALGIVVFGLSRYARLAPERFLDAGLVFAVFGALGISLAEFWRGFPAVASPLDYLGVPWECVWILIVPLVAPNTPNKILAASLAQASTGPIVVLALAAGRDMPLAVSMTTLVTYFAFTTYLCAGIAFVIARLVFRYGVRLKKAQEVGSYVLVERIGGGGMGDVWVATHRMLARPAAIKLIRPELIGLDARQNERAIARFEREARTTATLRSTHTVDIYDFGRTDEGDFFYVMELLEGMSLEALVRRFGPVPPARAVDLLRQICHSLGEAHARGLIHRDIKPANIFVCRLGPDVDFIKVLDFGLVKEVHQDSLLTQPSMVAGTPAYTAPEIALGHHDIDLRADLYALGCVAYWLLTGETVFHGATTIATLLAHAQTSPGAPSRLAPSPIPAELDALVLDCLAKDRSDRPPDAGEIDRRLAAITLTDTWTSESARAWWARHLPVPLPSVPSQP